MAAMQVRTWADHLEPIGYGNAIPVRSSDSMNREYPLEPAETGYSYWWTAEDGSLFFYPFGRATGLYNGASYAPQLYHYMWANDYPDPSVPPYTTQLVFGLVYMDDQDMSQMIGEVVDTNADNLTIDATAQMSFSFTGGPGQVIPPFPFSFGLIQSVGKLAPVT